jgi:hypothetical protein
VYALAGARVLVNDTITASAASSAVVGVQVRHQAWSADANISAIVQPGARMVSDCATRGITGQPATTAEYGSTMGLDEGTFGAPAAFGVWGSGVGRSAGVGLLALDDVFRVHAETANRAGPVDAYTAHCARSEPPAIELADPHLGLPAGEAATLEWAVYTVRPQDGSELPSDARARLAGDEMGGPDAPFGYYRFINEARRDSGVAGAVRVPAPWRR